MEVHHHAHTPDSHRERKKWTYDKPAIHQLYSMIRNAKRSLHAGIVPEKQYKEKAERLLTYLQKEYHLD